MSDIWGNQWKRWTNLSPGGALMVGEVLAIDGAYTVVRILGQGSIMRVKNGPSVVAMGHFAFVRDGAVEGEAPGLAIIVVDV